MNTTDLNKFGYYELREVIRLIEAYIDSPYILNEGVHIEMNDCGYVYLIDSDYNVAMINNGKLELYLMCPNCGYEEFESEFDRIDNCYVCKECGEKF